MFHSAFYLIVSRHKNDSCAVSIYQLQSSCQQLIFSSSFLQDMIKLCQNRVVLFDNMTSNIERREMQRRKLLGAVDFVISSNGGTAFSYKMLPHIQVIDSAFSSITSG